LLAGVSGFIDMELCDSDAWEGHDGTRLWDMQSHVQLMRPKEGHVVCGPVSCLVWVTRCDDILETLCFGTALGYLVFWRQGRDVSQVY
jgi:hypothetical protein